MAGVGAWVFGLGALVVACFQLAMVFGAPWGHLTMGGRWPGALPPAGRLAAALSGALILAMAHVMARQAGVIGGAPVAAWWGWGVLAFMALSIAMHLATPSRAERRLWLPIILTMTAGALAVMLAPA